MWVFLWLFLLSGCEIIDLEPGTTAAGKQDQQNSDQGKQGDAESSVAPIECLEEKWSQGIPNGVQNTDVYFKGIYTEAQDGKVALFEIYNSEHCYDFVAETEGDYPVHGGEENHRILNRDPVCDGEIIRIGGDNTPYSWNMSHVSATEAVSQLGYRPGYPVRMCRHGSYPEFCTEPIALRAPVFLKGVFYDSVLDRITVRYERPYRGGLTWHSFLEEAPVTVANGRWSDNISYMDGLYKEGAHELVDQASRIRIERSWLRHGNHVKVCHGNNRGVCSDLVALQDISCKEQPAQ